MLLTGLILILMLVSRGFKIDYPEANYLQEYITNTAIFGAVSGLIIGAISSLVRSLRDRNNASVDPSRRRGISTITIAVLGVTVALCAICGAITYAKFQVGSSLSSAARQGNLPEVRQFVNAGANIEFCTNPGYSPLVGAVENQHPAIAKFLIDHGANINRPSGFGYDVLGIAVANGEIDMVQDLVDGGADVNFNEYGTHETYLDEANRKGFADVAQYLKLHGGKTTLELKQ